MDSEQKTIFDSNKEYENLVKQLMEQLTINFISFANAQAGRRYTSVSELEKELNYATPNVQQKIKSYAKQCHNAQAKVTTNIKKAIDLLLEAFLIHIKAREEARQRAIKCNNIQQNKAYQAQREEEAKKLAKNAREEAQRIVQQGFLNLVGVGVGLPGQVERKDQPPPPLYIPPAIEFGFASPAISIRSDSPPTGPLSAPTTNRSGSDRTAGPTPVPINNLNQELDSSIPAEYAPEVSEQELQDILNGSN
jgi:hypothetical protein